MTTIQSFVAWLIQQKRENFQKVPGDWESAGFKENKGFIRVKGAELGI
jgi:hypothetical protein